MLIKISLGARQFPCTYYICTYVQLPPLIAFVFGLLRFGIFILLFTDRLKIKAKRQRLKLPVAKNRRAKQTRGCVCV